MITLLKTGYWKIMQIFYKEKLSRFHLREIARKTGLHEPSTTKFLNMLEKEQILKSEKDGNQKKFSINRTINTYYLFGIFDIEKFRKLPNIRRNAIKHYLKTLEEKPVFAAVFGSTAKETYKDESDLDLLIVTNRKINPEKAEKEAEALTGIKVSTFQITYEKFIKELKLKEEPVIQAAMTTGYPIINHVSYYEETLNE